MGRLTDHFEHRNRDNYNAGWSELWESNQEDLWDRGKPSPALIDFVEQRSDSLPRIPQGRRLKALVPGCGRGYDVVMLAIHGFDAYGLEVSQSAVNAANTYATSQLSKADSFNFGDTGTTLVGARGTTKFVVGDFFKTDWEEDCGAATSEGFDFIYDYTFLCAILPEMRLEWARRIKDLLSPSGILVCLEFPIYKNAKAAGPPFGMKGVLWDLFARGRDGVVDADDPSSNNVSASMQGRTLQRVHYYQPIRTYQVGEGTDMLSVWKHKSK